MLKEEHLCRVSQCLIFKTYKPKGYVAVEHPGTDCLCLVVELRKQLSGVPPPASLPVLPAPSGGLCRLFLVLLSRVWISKWQEMARIHPPDN